MSWLENLRYLQSLCETFSRKVLDDNGKKNIGDAAAAGLETKVIRSYDDVGLHGGKDDCEWCKKREGDWSYKEAIQKGVFERHPGCECTIDYVTAKGTKRQTNWRFNTWEDVPDHDTIERRKQYGRDSSASPDFLRNVHSKWGQMTAKEYYDYKRELDAYKDFEQIIIPKKEYAMIMRVFNSPDITEEERKHALITRAIRNKYYTVVNYGYDNYKLIDMWDIEPDFERGYDGD